MLQFPRRCFFVCVSQASLCANLTLQLSQNLNFSFQNIVCIILQSNFCFSHEHSPRTGNKLGIVLSPHDCSLGRSRSCLTTLTPHSCKLIFSYFTSSPSTITFTINNYVQITHKVLEGFDNFLLVILNLLENMLQKI